MTNNLQDVDNTCNQFAAVFPFRSNTFTTDSLLFSEVYKLHCLVLKNIKNHFKFYPANLFKQKQNTNLEQEKFLWFFLPDIRYMLIMAKIKFSSSSPCFFFLSTTAVKTRALPLTQRSSRSNNCSNATFHTSAHISSCVHANLQILTRSVCVTVGACAPAYSG